MIQIKFNSESQLYDCNLFRRISENVVMISFDSTNISGFKTIKDGFEIGDFSDYKTIYRKLDGCTYYSNDESIYVEPTTTIYATFDKDAPESIVVETSTGFKVTLESSSGFKKEVLGEGVCIVDTEKLQYFHYSFENNHVSYIEYTETEKIEEQVFELKKELASTDYQAIKHSEGWISDEDYEPIKQAREELRNKIRALENN